MRMFNENSEYSYNSKGSHILMNHDGPNHLLGIRKNSVPVFKIKTMGMTKSSSISHLNDALSVFPESTLNEETRHETQPNKINSLVSKAAKNIAVPVSKKEHIDNKVEGEFQCDQYLNNDNQHMDEWQQLEGSQELANDKEIHKLHMLQSLQALQYIKTVTRPPIRALSNKLVFLPPQKKHMKTLIFDMDETLIHCVDSIEDEDPQFIIKVPVDGEEVEAGINVRPYALECLEAANQQFEVVVFTASHQSYADAVLDFLDPDHELIKKRLYRDSCYETEEGVYIKDLRIFANRKM